jgi:hypothetical protein
MDGVDRDGRDGQSGRSIQSTASMLSMTQRLRSYTNPIAGKFLPKILAADACIHWSKIVP